MLQVVIIIIIMLTCSDNVEISHAFWVMWNKSITDNIIRVIKYKKKNDVNIFAIVLCILYNNII